MGRKEEGKRRWKEIHVLKKKNRKKGRISYLENPTFMS